MPADRIIFTGALVLVSGETTARAADLVLQGDTIAAIVPQVVVDRISVFLFGKACRGGVAP